MKHARLVSVAAIAASVVAAGHASAAVKKKPKPIPPVCNLVTDAPGDANGVNLNQSPLPTLPTTTAGSSDDALDVLSVDVATDKTTITAVLRLKKLAATSTNAPTGMTWSATYKVDTTTFYLAAHANPQGALTYDAAYASTAGGNLLTDKPTGSFDPAKGEIHISLPLAAMAKQAVVKPGMKITAIGATTGPEALIPDATGVFGGGTFFSDSWNTVDTASGGKDYTAGALSCVTPGK